MCFILQEGEQQVNAIARFNGQQRKYDPFSSTYNPGWRDHPNLSYGNRQQNFQPIANYQTAKSCMSLEDIVQSLANSTLAFQQETKSSIQNLENQMSQLATSVSKLESQGKLPSQTVPNPKQNVSAIMLRSGKELESASLKKLAQGSKADQKIEAEIEILEENQPQKYEKEQSSIQVIRPPFPERFAQSKREKEEKEILEIFRKVQVNILLLEIIKQIPRYAKFLKVLCTNKRNLYGHEKIKVGENVSAVLQRKIAQKCKNKDMFAISCSLKQSGVTLQLADRSIVYPKGVLEDILVQVGKLIFPADFFVLDMEDDSSSNSTDLLLGRPFLSTARTNIDVHEGTLSMEFDGEKVKFNVYDAIKHSDDNFSLCNIDVVDPLAQEAFKLSKKNKLEIVLTENLTMGCLDNSTSQFSEEIIEIIHSWDTLNHKASELELKLLPAHLKYREVDEIQHATVQPRTINKGTVWEIGSSRWPVPPPPALRPGAAARRTASRPRSYKMWRPNQWTLHHHRSRVPLPVSKPAQPSSLDTAPPSPIATSSPPIANPATPSLPNRESNLIGCHLLSANTAVNLLAGCSHAPAFADEIEL
ncbi:uncharacterized protein LOC122723840 [Manihot esculenta]|uniref:uncharacterized protein LOC122723840 n=1 Tax=Manihot esculenta TaxID=3983 RepID=UPI001CC39CAF|nr:uncharacterized protein LOC122723840 [Manihot esculenta]